MAKFTVKIWAYDHYASFDVEADDNPKSTVLIGAAI